MMYQIKLLALISLLCLFSFTGNEAGAASLVVTDVTVSDLRAVVGEQDSETISIAGVYLTSDLFLSLSGPDASQFSLTSPTILQSGGTVPNTFTFVHYSPNSAGTHQATLTISTAGAADLIRTLNGTATIATGLDSRQGLLLLRNENGSIVFYASKGEFVRVYNSLGQILSSHKAEEGRNSIAAPTKGLLIVKVGAKMGRIIL